MAKVYGGDQRARAIGCSCPVERFIYQVLRVDPEARAALERLRDLAAVVQRRLGPRAVPVHAGPDVAAARQRPSQRDPADLVQHRRQLRHQHELAELLRRDDDGPPRADGRAHGAELRVGRGRHGRRRRADPRTGPALGADARQLLGRPHPHDHAHPAADLVRDRRHPHEPGRDPELHPHDDGDTPSTRPCRSPPPTTPATRSPRPVTQQQIPGGPFASQEAIKELGTNGGGPLNANSMHPFENPTGLSNLLEIYALLVIGFAFPVTYGVMVGSKRQGRAVLAVMATLVDHHRRARRLVRAERQPGAHQPRRRPIDQRDPGGRQRRGQGDPLRPGDLGRVRRLDHRHVDRRGRRGPRQLHPARRDDPARQHEAR